MTTLCVDLLSCNAPGCNLTVCKCTNIIFPLVVLTKLIIFYSQYHMTCRGELSKPQGGWFCDDECKKNVLESLESADARCIYP